MSYAPKHDFGLFETSTAMARLDFERQASPIQKVERFAELVAICRGVEKPDLSPIDRQKRWMAEKLPIRVRQVAAFNSAEKAV
ncbi:hypothetical protein [Stieleria mannarensis]|uniref:hypothetical protein n=1 Tax=Stieleria mannarensis TaxID=2755585 RepID=UPI0016002035|nr:hypothetical protein [Rhodopirellula sp. JC639]